MADNKYITHTQENGTVMISEDVIATIVSNAVKDVEGVVSIEEDVGIFAFQINHAKRL